MNTMALGEVSYLKINRFQQTEAQESRESLRDCNILKRQLIVVLYHFNSRLFPN